MKKKLYPLLLVATLSFSACTEVLEPNVDYGGNTFINDYSALVEAVNNLNKSLQERFTALNTLLEKNMATLKLAIDENTGAIKVLSETTSQGLKDINTTLFNGFTALSNQIDAQGKSIVYAMNENGEILRMEIEKNGKLISAQILASSNALVQAINDQSKSLEERFAALNATLEAGLKEVYLSIDANTKAITTMDKNVNENLVKIDGSLTDGFTALDKTMTAQGTAIVGAINKQGELLVAEIQSNGKVISTQIKGSIDDLVEAMNNNHKDFNEKIDALNTTVQTGLAQVKASVDEVTGKIVLQTTAITNLDTNLSGKMDDLENALVALDRTISIGFYRIMETIDHGNSSVVEAINANGDILKLSIGKDGTLTSAVAGISDQLGTANDKLASLFTAVDSLTSSIGNLEKQLSNLTTAQKETLTEIKGIKKALEAMLEQEGIYNGTDGNLYMTPTAWKLVSADKTTDAYKAVENAAKTVEPTVTAVPTTTQTTSTYYSITSKNNAGTSGMYAVNRQVYTETGTSEQLYKIVKVTCQSVNIKVNASSRSYSIKYSTSADAAGDTHSGTARANSYGQFNFTFLAGEKLIEKIEVNVTRQ